MRVAVDIWGDGYVRIAHCVESTVGSGERRSSATVDERTLLVLYSARGRTWHPSCPRGPSLSAHAQYSVPRPPGRPTVLWPVDRSILISTINSISSRSSHPMSSTTMTRKCRSRVHGSSTLSSFQALV